MKILITGAAGFLAGAVIPLLRQAGHEVITADRRGEVDVVGDLADPAYVRGLPGVDTVLHAAAVQYVDPKTLPTFGRRAFFRRNNVDATRLLAERYASPDVHFVNVSTSMIYQQADRPLCTTGTPLAEQGLYSASKIAAKHIVDARPGPNATIIPCIIAGGGRGGLFVSLLESIRRRGFVVIPGRGDHPVHLVHVSDCAALIAKVIERRATGMFNAASRDAVSIRQWIREIENEFLLEPTRILALPLGPIHAASALLGYRPVPKERLLMLRYRHVLDVSEGEQLGWRAAYTNVQIVRDTVRTLADEP